MTLKGKGRIYRLKGRGMILYLPKEVITDSTFPFQIPAGQKSLEVMVHINTVQNLLIVTEVGEKAKLEEEVK